MVAAGAAQIGVVEERSPTIVLGCGSGVFARERRGDAPAIEDAPFDGAGGDRFKQSRIETAKGAQNPQACESAWGPDADRRHNTLRRLTAAGSSAEAE